MGTLPLVRKHITPTNKKVKFMADKEFETPQTVDVQKLAEAVAKKTAEEILNKTTPPAQPTALTESVEEPKPDPTEYRKEILEKLKDPTARGDMFYRKETLKDGKLKETIGAASGGGMTAWATDVFRCCPYPSSALWNPKRVSRIVWDAPFIKPLIRGVNNGMKTSMANPVEPSL